MMDRNVQGVVFNVQKFSVHDGKGIRTLVFLKGCPLRCTWCSNPESQAMQPELAFNGAKCLTPAVCGRCLTACQTGAISLRDGILCIDRSRCENCFACVKACPSKAHSIYGEVKSVDEVLRRVEEDSVFYARSGGGLSLSGGEAMAQPEFTVALLREARRRRINTAMECSLHCDWNDLSEACTHLNQLIMDIKCVDADKHKAHTGVGNGRIIKNFHGLLEAFPNLPIRVRTPIVPGFNDTEADVKAVLALLPTDRKGLEYELLSYHRMGQPKYEFLGRQYALEGVKADEALMARLRALIPAHMSVFS